MPIQKYMYDQLIPKNAPIKILLQNDANMFQKKIHIKYLTFLNNLNYILMK